MPLRTETYDLEAERDALVEACEEARERLEGLEPDTTAHDTVAQEAARTEQAARALHWAAQEWDAESVALGGLTGGEYGRVEDRLLDSGGPGAARVHTVAAGTVDAPYLGDDHDATVSNVADLPVGFLRWARGEIDDLSAVGNGLEIGSSDSSTGEAAASDGPSSSTTS